MCRASALKKFEVQDHVQCEKSLGAHKLNRRPTAKPFEYFRGHTEYPLSVFSLRAFYPPCVTGILNGVRNWLDLAHLLMPSGYQVLRGVGNVKTGWLFAFVLLLHYKYKLPR